MSEDALKDRAIALEAREEFAKSSDTRPVDENAVIARLQQSRSLFTVTETGKLVGLGGLNIADELRFLKTAEPQLFVEITAEKAETPDDERQRYGGFLKADFDALPKWRQAAIIDAMNGPAKANWQKGKAEIPPYCGSTPEAVAKLTPEQKLALANEAAFKALGYPGSGQ